MLPTGITNGAYKPFGITGIESLRPIVRKNSYSVKGWKVLNHRDFTRLQVLLGSYCQENMTFC